MSDTTAILTSMSVADVIQHDSMAMALTSGWFCSKLAWAIVKEALAKINLSPRRQLSISSGLSVCSLIASLIRSRCALHAPEGKSTGIMVYIDVCSRSRGSCDE